MSDSYQKTADRLNSAKKPPSSEPMDQEEPEEGQQEAPTEPAAETPEAEKPKGVDRPPRVIDVRGELEITVMKSLSAEKGDVYTQCEFLVNLTLDDRTKEGVVVLDVAKTRKLLKLLNLEGI